MPADLPGFGYGKAITIDGIEELSKTFRLFPDAIQDKVLRESVGLGATPIRTEARRRARRGGKARTGNLSRSIAIKRISYKVSRNAIAVIGPRRGFKDTQTGEDPANIAHLVELGTRPHPIPKSATSLIGRAGALLGRRKLLSNISSPWRLGAPQVFGTNVVVSAKPQPFLGPAFEAREAEAYMRIAVSVEKKIHKEAAKIGLAHLGING